MKLTVEVAGQRLTVTGRSASVIAYIAARQGDYNLPSTCQLVFDCGQGSFQVHFRTTSDHVPTAKDQEFVEELGKGVMRR